ncbi:MAG: acylneuraminate cytidylyltransferase [Nitrospira sp.]|nr:acylneuraminate cytidylyltransferase [Nitrospira sp.]
MNKLPNIVAIIPARGGSKSIPRKNIIDFCGKPLIAWSIELALASKYISDVYVTTDDKEIANVSQAYGAKIIWRPPELATDIASSEDALLHAISDIEKVRKIDLIVFLQATSPIRDTNDVDKAIEEFSSKKADSLFSAAVLEDFCIWEKAKSGIRSMTFDYKNRGRRQDRQPYYLENGSIYIFKPDILKQNNNRLGGSIALYQMPFWKSYEIDSIEDIEVCEYFMRNKVLKNQNKFFLLQNIHLIVYDFDGVFTDNKVILREDGLESVIVNRADGLAVGMLNDLGIKQIILSKEKNKVVETRGNKLGITVIKGVDNKKDRLVSYCREENIQLENVLYIGNDINDLEVMKIVGFPICPSDAYRDIKDISKVILDASGGNGVAREILKYIEKYHQEDKL